MVRAIRGATTVNHNTREEIFDAAKELVTKAIEENDVKVDDIVSIIFTMTPDLDKAFPCAAVRQLGITDVPLLDFAEPDIEGALKMCIRLMIHINTDKSNKDINHIYLNGAEILRPDLKRKKIVSVAIDGPAGAGKSSVSKATAKKLGYTYIDTGAMYRTAALYAINQGIDIVNDVDKLVGSLDNMNIKISYDDEGQKVFLNNVDVTGKIRTSEVTKGASDIAKIPEVRTRLVNLQREMAKQDNVIMDGRDICSVVLPNANVKIFLTASVDARAERRYKELLEKGVNTTLDEVKIDIAARDKNDSERAVSPLIKADDAMLLDTSDLDFDEVVDKLIDIIKSIA